MYRYGPIECDSLEELQAYLRSTGQPSTIGPAAVKPMSSGMYTITQKLDGRYHAVGRTQDSTERKICDSRAEAENFLYGVGDDNGWDHDAVRQAIEIYEEV